MPIDYISLLMYDFPMDTKASVRAYQRFHKRIIKLGYYQMQGSVYITRARQETLANIERQVTEVAPEIAHIRILTLTEMQFLKMKCISGEMSLSERIIRRETRLLEF